MPTVNDGVDEPQRLILPTQSKAKISHLLSYPIGAEQLSEAFADVPQFSNLRLHFYSGLGFGLRDVSLEGERGYEFLRVEYLHDASPEEKYPIMALHHRPPQHQWELIVQPVPRMERNDVRANIVAAALPQIRNWLWQRASQAKQGSDILAFFRGQESGEFMSRDVARLYSTVQRS